MQTAEHVQAARDLQWWTDEMTGLLRNAQDLSQDEVTTMVEYRNRIRTPLSAAYFEAVRLEAHSYADDNTVRTAIHQAKTPGELWAVVPSLGEIIANLRGD